VFQIGIISHGSCHPKVQLKVHVTPSPPIKIRGKIISKIIVKTPQNVKKNIDFRSGQRTGHQKNFGGKLARFL
jgi:hypothetical protein